MKTLKLTVLFLLVAKGITAQTGNFILDAVEQSVKNPSSSTIILDIYEVNPKTNAQNLFPKQSLKVEKNIISIFDYNSYNVKSVIPSKEIEIDGYSVKVYNVNKYSGTRDLFPTRSIIIK